MLKLRPWQTEALNKSLHWLLEVRKDRHFLINAAPGSGKTIAACVIADNLFAKGEIDRVIVIAPRSEVVKQWAGDFYAVTKRHMGKVTGSFGDVENLGYDVCATWSAIQGLQDAFQALCREHRVLVICDEHHHAAINAAWGSGAGSGFADAKFVLVLTGTPIRSDGEKSVWLAYDDKGRIDHPEEGTYTLTYGQAVDLGYCRPVTFHRHEGHFTVDLKDGQHIHVSSKEGASLPKDLLRIPGLQRALEFYELACTPQYERDRTTPLVTGYQGSMIEYAGAKLDDLRLRMPDAGGLVIAPSIEIAEYMAELVERVEGEAAIVVHSQMKGVESRIEAFKKTDRRWLVSVAMISEGVDIPRLRVLIYLPNALTELAFRQAIGRVVRNNGPEDDTRAYVVMPSFETFEVYARRVEEEMSAGARKEDAPAKMKRCPMCASEVPLGVQFCESCGFEFPKAGKKFKICEQCQSQNLMSAKICQACGAKFGAEYVITLDEALRTGAIIRGMDLDEQEVQQGEEVAPIVRSAILDSGDATLIRMMRSLPEESFGRLQNILDKAKKN